VGGGFKDGRRFIAAHVDVCFGMEGASKGYVCEFVGRECRRP
jgi:hypothetical protein